MAELQQIADHTEHLRSQQVEDIYRKAFDLLQSAQPVAQQAWQTATQVLEAREEAGKRLNARLREAMGAMPIAAIREVK